MSIAKVVIRIGITAELSSPLIRRGGGLPVLVGEKCIAKREIGAGMIGLKTNGANESLRGVLGALLGHADIAEVHIRIKESRIMPQGCQISLGGSLQISLLLV